MTTTGEGLEQTALTTAMSEVYAASAARASMVGGGSLSAEEGREPEELERDLDTWYPDLNPIIKRLNSPSLLDSSISQVGPLNTGYITFSGGVPVGGYARATSRSLRVLGSSHSVTSCGILRRLYSLLRVRAH